MHLIAQTLLSVETLELEQIKRLVETGTLDGGPSSDATATTTELTTEPIVETIGDVKVRIQTREQDEA